MPVLGAARNSKTDAAVKNIKNINGCNTEGVNNGTSTETFVEIDRHDKDDVFLNLAKPNMLNLFYLAFAIGPTHGYGGLGWQDLFAECTNWTRIQWVPIKFVKMLCGKFRTNDDCMFRLWLCRPGLVHVEVDDNGTWTVEEIVSLPEWMIIG